jgi:putative ABC transport system permease protein
MVQLQAYMDIGMGVGIVIHGLAALMIGEAIIGNETLNKQLLAPLIGALIYQQIQGMAINFGLAPSDLKFLTGFIVLSVIAMQKREASA